MSVDDDREAAELKAAQLRERIQAYRAKQAAQTAPTEISPPMEQPRRVEVSPDPVEEVGPLGEAILSVVAMLLVGTAWAVLPPPIYFLILATGGLYYLNKAKRGA